MMEKFVGKLELGDRVDITDPCYDRGTKGSAFGVQCTPGTYYGYVKVSQKEGHYIRSIAIYKDNKKVPQKDMKTIKFVGVDAGLCGFFADKPDYSDEEWDRFVDTIYEDETADYWNLFNGIFSSSGYGDGCYPVCANDERTAFLIQFID